MLRAAGTVVPAKTYSLPLRPEWLMIPAKRKYQWDGTQLDINDKRQNSKTQRYDTTCYMQSMQLMAMRVKIWSCPLAPTWVFLYFHGSDSWNMIILICGVDRNRYPSILLYFCIPNQAGSRRYVYIYIYILYHVMLATIPCTFLFCIVCIHMLLFILHCILQYAHDIRTYIARDKHMCFWYLLYDTISNFFKVTFKQHQFEVKKIIIIRVTASHLKRVTLKQD